MCSVTSARMGQTSIFFLARTSSASVASTLLRMMRSCPFTAFSTYTRGVVAPGICPGVTPLSSTTAANAFMVFICVDNCCPRLVVWFCNYNDAAHGITRAREDNPAATKNIFSSPASANAAAACPLRIETRNFGAQPVSRRHNQHGRHYGGYNVQDAPFN